jgi:cysteine desulfurase
MIYFDTASSYPILPEVKQALAQAFETLYANSSSSHSLGCEVSEKVNEVRSLIADEIGAYPSELIFTSGATESNNIAIKSLLLGGRLEPDKKHIVTSQIEHKCIFAICEHLKVFGYDITYVKPNREGIITSESVLKAIRFDTALVSIMHVNNELGTINPIGEIGEICKGKQILFHSDAAQSFQKLKIDVDELNIDIMSFSAHKIGGPKGIGAVFIRDLRNKELMPVIHGAGQEEGVRGGTVASPLVEGFRAAIENFSQYYQEFSRQNLKEFFVDELDKNGIEFIVNGMDNSLQSCLSLTLPSVDVAVLIRDNESSLCLAQGSACSSRDIEASHVLTAIGLSREEADKTLRISFPLDISKENILYLVETIHRYSLE